MAAGLLLLMLVRPAAADVAAPPPDFDATTETDSLLGTEWTGSDGPVAAVVTFHFERGGALFYSYNGASFRNGTWKQKGTTLYFEMNNKFRECQATIHGGRIDGDSWNINGLKWRTNIQRSKASP